MVSKGRPYPSSVTTVYVSLATFGSGDVVIIHSSRKICCGTPVCSATEALKGILEPTVKVAD